MRSDDSTSNAGGDSVIWLAVAAYAKQAAARFGTTEIAFAGTIGPDMAALRREVSNGRPTILEQPGHYVLATGESGAGIGIADQFYADRLSLSTPAYGNRFLSGRLFQPGPDASAIMVVAPRGVRFAVRDTGGATTGLPTGASSPVAEVTQSYFSREAAWRDPTCTASSPRPNAAPPPEGGRGRRCPASAAGSPRPRPPPPWAPGVPRTAPGGDAEPSSLPAAPCFACSSSAPSPRARRGLWPRLTRRPGRTHGRSPRRSCARWRLRSAARGCRWSSVAASKGERRARWASCCSRGDAHPAGRPLAEAKRGPAASNSPTSASET